MLGFIRFIRIENKSVNLLFIAPINIKRQTYNRNEGKRETNRQAEEEEEEEEDEEEEEEENVNVCVVVNPALHCHSDFLEDLIMSSAITYVIQCLGTAA
ncbi:Hypothetical predicted protein [Octopus vulgaris]|uniref:Uncharacterized protein n=1 Tax=Octopus vulgaris TaxID=6645 RepID=A0AA36EX89_OCTVU|nr:Hypothetical predicted protein [Octopus vulgaris]